MSATTVLFEITNKKGNILLTKVICYLNFFAALINALNKEGEKAKHEE